ncbi:MAG: ABC transporter permease [Sphaerochaeta sp.]|jgi:peptide/nickel transport system permease protein|uniref:Oligopeptide transport system permease protein OppC n=1 Tax=bioreactor metagenome TaxID=1076179 RepID=A0A644WN01_9ZZZZ|nr:MULTISPECIES: ABC transporter permease [Sphaerochaeta]MDD3059022.1 ABC transporter permease [Sphaerochaeta sp.]MDD4038820.1 ABC transporter permease [Sphaerochaeta sp.]MEA5029924.1 ABC transporter permease [Sphaerochaeta associata]MEA5105895.1 ABC transporter permease [Sphaerochaeta associata]
MPENLQALAKKHTTTKWSRIVRNLRSALFGDFIGTLGFILLMAIILMSLIGPVWFPLDTVSDPTKLLMPPSSEHILGTDHLGRDVWAQIVSGGRELLLMSFLTAIIAVVLGITLGSLSALVGGKFDEMLLFFADVWLTIPRFPLLVVLSGFFTLNATTLAFVLAILSWAGLYRTVRAEVLSLRNRDFVEAAFMLDMGKTHIIFKEVLPNMMGFVVANFTLLMRAAIYSQVGLVFLGLLPLDQNWGVMINVAWNQGVIYNPDAIWFLLAPTIVICLLILSLVWISRSMEEFFNPALQK